MNSSFFIQHEAEVYVDRQLIGDEEVSKSGFISVVVAFVTLVYFSYFATNLNKGTFQSKSRKKKKYDTLFVITLDRLFRWKYNWEHETLRSLYESCSILSVALMAFNDSNISHVTASTITLLAAFGSVFFSNLMGLGVTISSYRSTSMKKQGQFFFLNFVLAMLSLWKSFDTSYPVISIITEVLTWIAMACLTELLLNHYCADIFPKTEITKSELPPLLTKWSIVVKVINCLFGNYTGKKPELEEVTLKHIDKISPEALHDHECMFAKAAKGRVVNEMIKGKKWVLLEGYVFDVEKFASRHPGGEALLLDYAKRHADITDQFAVFHHPSIYRRLPGMMVGKFQRKNPGNSSEEEDKSTAASYDYRKLNAFLWDNGYFDGAEVDEESAFVTLYRHLGLLCLGILSVFQVVFLSHSMTENHGSLVNYTQCVLAAITFGIYLQQDAFIAHDACHNCVVNRSKEGSSKYGKIIPNNFLGWFHGAVIFGISSARWIDDHSVHHAMTMRPMEDAQFKYLPIWCASRKEFATKTWHDMCKQFPPIKHITKCLVYVQHYTLLPLAVIIGRFNFYILNITYAIQNGVIFDLVGMSIYWCSYIYLISYLSEDIWMQVVFTLVSHATVGILHVQLLVNHLATDAFTVEEEEKMSWLEFQIKTTRNIDSTKNWDWFHGGLQYQIEHHLFPQLPRHRLPLIKPVLMGLCARHGLNYESVPLLKSVVLCLANFREIADEVWSGDLAIA